MAEHGRNATRFTNVKGMLGGQMVATAQEIDPKISRTAVRPKTSPGGGAHYLRLIECCPVQNLFLRETRPGMDGEPEAMQFDDCDHEAQTEAQALRMPAPVGAIAHARIDDADRRRAKGIVLGERRRADSASAQRAGWKARKS
jgi:hypothetical protein